MWLLLLLASLLPTSYRAENKWLWRPSRVHLFRVAFELLSHDRQRR
jgi:hypothetical protein